MPINSRALPVPWQVSFSSDVDTGRADTFTSGTGGAGGFRPHELLEAALATCLTITARMELRDRGVDDRDVAVVVELQREESCTRFVYILVLPAAVEEHRAAILGRLESSSVRGILSKSIAFEGHAVTAPAALRR